MRFVEYLLYATARIETSSENPAAWQCCIRASLHADVVTSHPRCVLVKTTGLDGMKGTKVDPDTAASDAETTVETATRANHDDQEALSDAKFLVHFFVKQGKQEETCTSTIPAKVVIGHPPPLLWASESETHTGGAEYCGL